MRFVHCADLHLDTAFSGLGDKDIARIRQAELRKTFLSIIDLAKERDALFIAGDLFDQDSIEAETFYTLQKGFASLGDIPVFIAAGNHDPLTEKSYYRLAEFSPNVHIFDTKTEKVSLPDCTVYGISFSQGDCPQTLVQNFSAAGDVPGVFILHGDLGGREYNPIVKEQVASWGISYLALGHVHGFSQEMIGKTLCAYPGCPEGRGFDELGEKGVICGEITKDNVQISFVPVCQRQYREIKVDVSGLHTHGDVLEKIMEEPLNSRDLYKIILTGKTDFVPEEAVLKEGLSHLFFVKIYDRTQMDTDYGELVKEKGVRGMFVEKMLALFEKEGEAKCQKALELGLSALEGKKVKGL